MRDPLALLWPFFDAPRPLLSHDLVVRWPVGLLERLLRIGFVAPAESASRVVCPGCYEGHVENVTVLRYPDGSQRFFVYCPEALRAEVPAEHLRQWTIDFEQLAGALASEMALHGTRQPLLLGRLWRLGKAAWRGGLRDVLLARGIAKHNASEVVGRIKRIPRPIVLVGKTPPPRDIWGNAAPAVVPLADVVCMEEDRLVVDAAVMAAMVVDADEAWGDGGKPLFDQSQLRRLIRIQRKSELSDDVFVAAYKQHGSYRKAADALIAQGVETDRWAIERAVRRAGGAAALRRSEDSGSVSRARVSRRRDGKRIFSDFHKPK